MDRILSGFCHPQNKVTKPRISLAVYKKIKYTHFQFCHWDSRLHKLSQFNTIGGTRTFHFNNVLGSKYSFR